MIVVAALLATACPNEDIDTTDSTQTLSPESTMTAAQEDSSSSSGDAEDETTDVATSLTTAPAEESSSTGDDVSGCNVANPCEVGYCVAPYADNDRGEFACVPDCVMPGDETSWCFDAAACCDAEATCTERGYCVSPDDTSSTG